MKKLFLSLMSMAVVLLTYSCKDNSDSSSISTDDAAEMISMSMSSDAMGATSFISGSVDASANASDNGMLKAKATTVISKDTTISYASNSNALITYSMNANMSYQFSVDAQNQVTNSTVTYDYNGNFDAPRLSSVHTGSGNLSLTGIDTDICMVNGLFKRTSDVQTKGVNAKETNSETTIVLTDIQVNKSTEQILSGTATVSITGSLASKGDFSYSGTITFNGAGLATLVLGSKSYSVNLETGDYTAL